MYSDSLVECLSKFRFIRFGIVGACASSLQVVVLKLLTAYGLPDPAANAIGIVAGAVLSFPLSKRYTWKDRSVNNQAVAWTTFMTIAFCAFATNEGVFIVASYLGVSRIPASLLGICSAIVITWTGNNRLTFRRQQSHEEAVSTATSSHHYDIDLSIILPALNEAQHIGATLDQLAEYLKVISLGVVEVIVVAADGGDDTASIALTRANTFQHFHVINPGPIVGKGRDVREGMLNARGRYRMFMDADLATPLRHLSKVQEFMLERGQVGIGVRRMGRYHNSLIRNFISLTSSLLTILFVIPIKDARCGFKVFEANVAEELFSRIKLLRWGFDIEVLAMARQFGYSITPFMVTDWHDPRENGQGLAHEKWLRIIFGNMFDPLRVRFNLMVGKYRSRVGQHRAHRQAQDHRQPVPHPVARLRIGDDDQHQHQQLRPVAADGLRRGEQMPNRRVGQG